MKKFMEEFKAFAMRGNVLDMAIGVVIGGAFKAIADSLVNDIINPAIGLFFNADFSEVGIHVGDVRIGIGSFLNAIINFLIVAFVVFLLVKGINKMRREQPAETAAPTPTEALLAEIRDGSFARQWIAEYQAGNANYKALRQADLEHPIEAVGRQMRAQMPWLATAEVAAPPVARTSQAAA